MLTPEDDGSDTAGYIALLLALDVADVVKEPQESPRPSGFQEKPVTDAAIIADTASLSSKHG
jgi:hypothetical protein